MTSILWLIEAILRNQFRYYYLKNKRVFVNFLLHFWNVHEILNIFKKRMTLIADVFPKLPSPKKGIALMSEKSRFRMPFHKQHGKRAQTLLQSGRHYLYHIYWLLWTWFSRKNFMLVLCKILRLFLNTLIHDDKYSLLNRGNFTQLIQMLLYQKQKTFSEFLYSSLKYSLNFEHFQKKEWPS